MRVTPAFAVEGERKDAVRDLIESALAAGRLAGPEGNVTRLAPHSADEADHAVRPIAG